MNVTDFVRIKKSDYLKKIPDILYFLSLYHYTIINFSSIILLTDQILAQKPTVPPPAFLHKLIFFSDSTQFYLMFTFHTAATGANAARCSGKAPYCCKAAKCSAVP